MKVSLKAINAALPRFDELRRRFMATNTTGWIDGREFLKAAFADVDADTGTVGITTYTEGDAMEARHYHSEQHAETVVDITEQIEDAISGARRGDYRYDSRAFRTAIIREIYEAINNRINGGFLMECTWEQFYALPVDLRDSVFAFWEAGYDYSDPEFWNSFDPAPEPKFVKAVQMYDWLMKNDPQ